MSRDDGLRDKRDIFAEMLKFLGQGFGSLLGIFRISFIALRSGLCPFFLPLQLFLIGKALSYSFLLSKTDFLGNPFLPVNVRKFSAAHPCLLCS